MKKIGICTLYEACNMGAILQAFSLQEKLKELGYEPEFINLNTEIVHNKNVTDEFLKMRKYLNISEQFYNKEKKYDAIIVGSDEVWNLKNQTFEHIDEFLGYNLVAPKVIAYAPGASETNAETFINYYKGQKDLSNFTNLSARDTNAKNIIKKIANKDVPLVLDPTLLINSYEPYIKEFEENDYILVYGWFFKNDEIEAIQRYAKLQGLKLYSVGFELEWCDKFLGSNIFSFLGYMKNARYVVLSQTFHGIVFSIIFNKQFITYTHGNFKSDEILKRAGLEDRGCMQSNEINRKLLNRIDYTKTNLWIKEERKKSIDFLISSINN